MSDQSGLSFGRDSTATVLRAACQRVDLDPAGAELMRLGENAIYRLGCVPVVVRIARGMDHWRSAVKEVAVARWLATSGIAAAQTWALPQPIEVDGHPVTFWRFIDGRRGNSSDVASLGRALRQLHELPRPADFELPAEDVLGRVELRIQRAQVRSADRSFLTTLLGELRDEIKQLDFVLPEAVTHGDAHVQNLLVCGSDVVLIDFERVSRGHPEWDLAMTATEYVTAQWWTTEQYAEFSDSYGFDVMSWEGFDTLRRVYEIKMTTWLMQNIRESSHIQTEYAHRMQTIRERGSTAPWRAF